MFRKAYLPYKILLALLVLTTACNKNSDEEPEPMQKFEENKYIRLLFTEVGGDEVELLNPSDLTARTKHFDAHASGAALYPSFSGRYGILVHRAENKVEIFDTGIEAHGDHAHADIEPRLLAHQITGSVPTHFYAFEDYIKIFNDGDASVLSFRESHLRRQNFSFQTLRTNAEAHHGVAAPFADGRFVASIKKEGAPGALPQFIALYDRDGNLIRKYEDLEVTGIHGDAANGDWVLVGSSNGVLAVNKDGNAKLIANKSGLNPESGNWLGTIMGHAKLPVFYGRSRNLGVFFINPATDEIRTVFNDAPISSLRLCPHGRELYILTNDGSFYVFDARTGTPKGSFSGKAAARTEDNIPVFGLSGKYVYVTNRMDKSVKVYERGSFREVHTFQLDHTPANIAVLGWFGEH
jgi:hypothetical protein